MARRITYYDILGARPSDDATALRDAYRRAQKRYHPDLASTPDDRSRREAASRLINTAYAVLRDPEQRARYDAAMAAAVRLRFDPTLLFRGRGTWLLRVQLPGVPRMPRGERLAAVLNEIWATRLGQWALLLLGTAAAWVVARDTALQPVLAMAAAAGIGALLARGGSPTPATDAVVLLDALTEAARALMRAVIRRGNRTAERLREAHAGYQRPVDPNE